MTNAEYYSKEEYEALPLEEAFHVTLPALGTENWKTALTEAGLDFRAMIY